jgi:hypothetical protein
VEEAVGHLGDDADLDLDVEGGEGEVVGGEERGEGGGEVS